MAKLISNKVKKVSSDQADPNRYEFLSLEHAEPDLGLPEVKTSVLTSTNTGTRVWTSNLELDYLFTNTLITEHLSFPSGPGSTGQVIVTDGAGNLSFETLTLQSVTDGGNVTNNDILINANLQATELNGGGAGITDVDAVTLDGENKSYFTAYANAAADDAYSNAVTYTDNQITAIINAAPAVLDTLVELANAINNDENFAVTIANQISTAYSNAVAQIGEANVTITGGSGLTGSGTLNVNQFSDLEITIEHGNTSSQGNVENADGTTIQDIYVDEYGHITNIVSANLDLRYLQQEVDTLESVTGRGNITNNDIISFGNVEAVYFVGNGEFVTSVDAELLDGEDGSYYTNFASNTAGNAYSNAISYADDIANTAYSNAISYADNAAAEALANAESYANSVGEIAYSNAVSYADDIANTAYSNAVSYADSVANTAYSNAISYADDAANTAYSNAVSYADSVANTAYSNAISYADDAANTAYSNAVAYVDAQNTDTIEEGSTNLYYLDSRVDSHLSGANGISYSLGVISASQDISSGANVTFTKVTGLDTPTGGTDAATKAYVDEVAEGLKTKPAVEVITLSDLSATYDNANNGVGATLTADSNTAWPEIDGYTVNSTAIGENGILVAGQSNTAHNGRYNLTTIGDGSNPWVLTRCGVCDEADEIAGAFIFVKHGTTYAGTGWVLIVDDAATFVTGTDPITVTQFSQAGVYTANNGLVLNGLEFSIDANAAIIANSFSGNGASITSVDAETVGGNTAADLLDYNNFTNTPNSAVETLASAGTVDFDFSNTINFNVTLTQNTTFTFSNLTSAPGQTGLMVINQDVTGGHSFTLPASAKTPVGGAAIDQVTTGSTSSLLNYFVVNSSAVFVNYIGDFQ